MPLKEERLLEDIKSGSLFGYVHYDFEVTENLREAFINFPPIFKNINVGRDVQLWKNMPKKKEFLTQPTGKLISSIKFFFGGGDGTIIIALLLFYLVLGLVCKKIYCLVKYTPIKCFNNFVQSAVKTRREGDQNSISSAVAETMKLVANSSHGYQNIHRSRQAVTKYLSDEKTHGAIKNKTFKRLGYKKNDQLYEVQLVKSETEHKEPIIVGMFLLQYTKLQMLELYSNFFDKYCDITKFEELEMDIDFLYLALSENDFYDCIRPAMKKV